MKPLTLLLIIILNIVGGYDLYRVIRKKKTISQKIHAWCGKWGDAAILSGCMILVWICLGPDYFVTVFGGVLLGHLFWNGDK